ncbi:hypothetical protein GCM10009037_11390 [Halarchaeum grantii]|uniref:Nudix hydrolase domain-containing protein n=1 Tax=Halarchaeum grantii TaxID=1193105 RepID=A0A830FB91_9EURY|nr:NUDIX domain-containing protein [Halarchaeum grantii]GGL29446.1 hypothetical protein GCM10009037_11390 [Halarchaeum grantii]
MSDVRAAARGLLTRDGRYLLLEADFDAGTRYVLPGGGVDFGETHAETVEREVREETGLDVDAGAVVDAYTFTVEYGGGAHHVSSVVLACEAGAEAVDVTGNVDDEPLVGHVWATPADARELPLADGLPESLFADADIARER